MIAYVIRRLASIVVVMVLVGVCVFLLLHLAPGDPAAIIAGDNATPEQIAAIRAHLGLDEALPVQFLRWSASVLSGDLGVSIFSNTPVTTLIGQRLEPTLSLSLATLAHRYNVGFYRRGSATLYVHPGLGTTGPPMRLGVAPEVTILVLRAESPAMARHEAAIAP